MKVCVDYHGLHIILNTFILQFVVLQLNDLGCGDKLFYDQNMFNIKKSI